LRKPFPTLKSATTNILVNPLDHDRDRAASGEPGELKTLTGIVRCGIETVDVNALGNGQRSGAHRVE
jgi:hypothetical protein